MAEQGQGGLMTRDRVLVIVLFAATALVFYLCYLVVKPLIATLAWALALAVFAQPLYRRIAARLHNPNVAAGAAVVAVALLIVGPSIFVVRQIGKEASTSVQAIREQGTPERLKRAIERNSRVAGVYRWIEANIDIDQEMKKLGESVSARVPTFVQGSIWAVTELLIVLFALFFFFRDRKQAMKLLRSLMPLTHQETDRLCARVANTIDATIYGTFVVAIIQGTLGGLMFWWLGLPAPLLWGAVMALLAIVPVLGAFVIWVPAAFFLVLDGQWAKALILTTWGTVVVGTIDNLLYPMLVGKKLRMHTLPVFYAIVGGLMVFGAVGIILGPVIFALAAALVDVWRLRTADGQPAEEGLKPDEHVRDLVSS